MTAPFLTLITRCCERPKMLSKAIKSALAQTDPDFEIIFIPDFERRGVKTWANKQFALNLHRVDGEYIYCLDDDTFLPDKHLVERLKGVPGRPGLIMVKSRRPQRKPNMFPIDGMWGHRERLRIRSCNGGCFVSHRDTWERHAYAYGKGGSGDWNYLKSVKDDPDVSFHWLDIVGLQTQQLGRGRRFEQCGSDWFERVVEEFGIEEVAPGDWRLRP